MIQKLKVKGTKGNYTIFEKILGKGAYGVVCLAQCENDGTYLAAKIVLILITAEKMISNQMFKSFPQFQINFKLIIKYFNAYQITIQHSYLKVQNRIKMILFFYLNNFLFCIQVIKKSLSIQDIQNLRNEMNIQQTQSHPNIVSMIDTFEDEQFLYMMLEYCSGGCLFQNLQLNGPFKEEKAFQYFSQILSAVQQLHKTNIIHRDIKLSNILLTDQDQVKLADFTWATNMYYGEVNPQLCGTLEYMPPEVTQNKTQSEKLDIWSLGIVLYELLHNSFPDIDNLFIKNNISQECKDLILMMLEKPPFRRPTALNITLGSWFKKMINQKLLIKPIISVEKTNSSLSKVNLRAMIGSPLKQSYENQNSISPIDLNYSSPKREFSTYNVF